MSKQDEEIILKQIGYTCNVLGHVSGAEYRKLQSRILALREALQFYSRPIDYNVHATGGYGLQKNPDRLSRIDADEGKTAREALKKDTNENT